MKKCAVEGCETKYHGRGYCNAHLHRFVRYGNPNAPRKRALNGIGYIDESGYRAIEVRRKKTREHRLVMEKHLGRSLLGSEHIHHINHNKLNNRIENLELINQSDHMKKHAKYPVIDGYKICSKCKNLWPIAFFTRNRRNSSGIHVRCRNCTREYNRQFCLRLDLDRI